MLSASGGGKKPRSPVRSEPRSPVLAGSLKMNTAGRYQSRRAVGRALDPIAEQGLKVKAETRRGSLQVSGPTGRRKSLPVTEVHFDVKDRASSLADGDAAARLMAAKLHASQRRRAFQAAVRGQTRDERHERALLAHSDLVARTIPPPLTLALYREVAPILTACVKAYTRSLGRNHQLTADCVERHQEVVKRLAQLEMMHATPDDRDAATA